MEFNDWSLTWRRRRRRRRRRSLFRIVHARGAIPNEVGPARCRATPALSSRPTRPTPRPPGVCRRHVLAVCPLLDLVSGWPDGVHSRGVPTAPSWAWCLGGQTGYARRERRLPPLGLGWAGGGGEGGEVRRVRESRAAIGSVRHHIVWVGCMVRGPATTQRRRIIKGEIDRNDSEEEESKVV